MLFGALTCITSMIRLQSGAVRNAGGFRSALRHADTAESWPERGVSNERPSPALGAALVFTCIAGGYEPLPDVSPVI